jgi:hypothetical protein
MATAGYSGTPLVKKLGIKAGSKLLLINPPVNYYELVGHAVKKNLVKTGETADIIHLFATSEVGFFDTMQKLKPSIHPKVVIWVSWYKKSSGIKTDVTEETIRQYALSHDLVDVKVCAVDDQWSALKLVVPLSKR